MSGRNDGEFPERLRVVVGTYVMWAGWMPEYATGLGRVRVQCNPRIRIFMKISSEQDRRLGEIRRNHNSSAEQRERKWEKFRAKRSHG